MLSKTLSMAGQIAIEFHEQKVVKVQEDDHGDDKDKNNAKAHRK